MSKDKETKESEKFEKPEDKAVETRHKVMINGREIDYTVTTGTMILKEEEEDDGKSTGEQPKAAVFYVAYTKNDVDDVTKRSITFSFNGGPGSSSVWLHLGLLGPRRVLLDEDGNAPLPPFQLVDNEYSLLDETDLVFIDPVSTGYSRAVPGEKPKEFHDFKKDIESVGEFIRLYTTRNLRWRSPKFLIGESYGTTRAAGLSGHLQERHGYYLNGIIFVSVVLDFQTILFNIGNDLPYILYLPSYAATAWYHGRLADELQADLQATLAEAEEYALTGYTLALMKGDTLSSEERTAVQTKLARLTGLSPDYIDRANLRVEIHRFVKELLRDERRTAGRLDSRFLGSDRDSAGSVYEYDPSYAVIQGAYTATLNDYLRRELEYESDLPYEIISQRVHPWSYDEHQNRFVNVAETLRKAMNINPHLKVFVANGYYDLATPYLGTNYTFNHLSIEAELQSNISIHYYEAGHMMYVHLPSLAQLKADLAAFVQSAVP
jgi:carboxypeptidase C (cathepsin A)